MTTASCPPRRSPSLLSGGAVSCVVAAILLAGLPVVGADHVYSHRYVFEGRVVGADGLPLAGEVVEFYAEGDDFLDACSDTTQQAVTDQWGDFRFCFHKHDLGSTTGVGVRVAGHDYPKPLDTAFRRSVVFIEIEERNGTAPPAWNTTYRFGGKVWQGTGPRSLEGVEVFGIARADMPVNVTVSVDGVEQEAFATVTDGYGDFDVEIVTNASVDNVTVSFEAGGTDHLAQPSASHHRTTVGLFLPPDYVARRTPEATSTPIPAVPGTTTPPLTSVVVLGLGLALVAAVVVAKRRRVE